MGTTKEPSPVITVSTIKFKMERMPFFVILASFFLPTTHCIPKLKLLGGSGSRNPFWQGEGIQRPYVAEITPDAGSNWGDWGSASFCPEGSWATGFQLKVEPDCGAFCDDTALNGVKLFCANPDGTDRGEVTSTVGSFGGWKGVHRCSPRGSAIRGIQFRSEAETRLRQQGVDNDMRHMDETAGNNIDTLCMSGDVLVGDGGSFGLWSDYVLCPDNTAVCGIKTKVEQSQGASDDTALNQITLYCCTI